MEQIIRNRAQQKVCCDRICNTYQHGLGNWLAEEVGHLYRNRDDLEKIIQNKCEQLDDARNDIEERDATINEQVELIGRFEIANQELLRKCIRTTLQRRAEQREHTEDLQRLKETIKTLRDENTALARALRAKPMNQWTEKKRKLE